MKETMGGFILPTKICFGQIFEHFVGFQRLFTGD